MHLITGVLSIIGLAIVGFTGHVLAHDFCERAPALARGLLAIATKWLPPANRARYAEEWAAHLADCKGLRQAPPRLRLPVVRAPHAPPDLQGHDAERVVQPANHRAGGCEDQPV